MHRGVSSTIRELPLAERPRERLLASGGADLTDGELVAILLRTGCAGTSALELARELLVVCGGLGGLARVGAGTPRPRGLGLAKSATLLAAVELARRLARASLPERDLLSNPEAAARYLVLRFGVPDQEVMGALFLDIRNRLLAERELFRGTLNRTAVEPRAVFKQALLTSAAGVLLFHTHPSGDPSPSAEDLAFTRRMAEAGDLLGIRLVDHLILGSSELWVSLRRRGAW